MTPRRDRRTVGLLAVGIAYACGSAVTTPFTVPADVLTALPIVALAVLAVARWPGRAARWRPAGSHPCLAWAVWFVVVVAWELVEYTQPDRHAHPTVSSLADAVDDHTALKAAVFFGWLCLGALILAAGHAVPVDEAAAPGPGPAE